MSARVLHCARLHTTGLYPICSARSWGQANLKVRYIFDRMKNRDNITPCEACLNRLALEDLRETDL